MPSGSNGWPLPRPDSLGERTGHEWQHLSEQVVAWRGEPGSARSVTKPRHYVTSKLTSAEKDKLRAEAHEIAEIARASACLTAATCTIAYRRNSLTCSHTWIPSRLDNLIVITGGAAREARARFHNRVHELWEKHLEWFRKTGNAPAASEIEGIASQIDKEIRSSKEWTAGRLK